MAQVFIFPHHRVDRVNEFVERFTIVEQLFAVSSESFGNKVTAVTQKAQSAADRHDKPSLEELEAQSSAANGLSSGVLGDIQRDPVTKGDVITPLPGPWVGGFSNSDTNMRIMVSLMNPPVHSPGS